MKAGDKVLWMGQETEVIYVYTREQAFEDGVLIDVTLAAAEAGFVWSVALTAAVWSLIQDISPKLVGIQDVAGRLWDVLTVAQHAIARSSRTSDTRELLFT